MKNNNVEVGYKFMETHNELIYLKIEGVTITPSNLSNDVVALLTAISYVDELEQHSFETYQNLSIAVLGYDTVINALKELYEMGFELLTQREIRKLVINKNKNKYNGLMR